MIIYQEMIAMKEIFNVMNLVKCSYDTLPRDNPDTYIILPKPLKGTLFVSFDNLGYMSGQVRVRGNAGGKYPFHYLEMIEYVFGREENTIEVCSGSVNEKCFTVDLNPETNPQIVDDGQTLYKIPNDMFNRWRCDPPYNENTARKMYGTDLPKPIRLLEAGARVCRKGSLMFMLLGPTNYQWHPKGTKRIAYIDMTVVPNNEVRCLNVFYKYGD
jgi:hypothetical protein